METDQKTCAYCGTRSKIMTKDHIIPKRTGARLFLPCGSRNYKWACALCNNLREHASDCPAVSIMALRLARELKIKPRRVLSMWGFIGGRSSIKSSKDRLAAYHADKMRKVL